MTDYPKIKLSEEIEVPGGLKDYTQTYQWVYYLEFENYPNKAALYLNWTTENKKLAYRSVYFTHPEHVKKLVKESVWAFLYLKEKKIKPLPELLDTTRNYWLNELIEEIKKEVKSRWTKQLD